MTAPKGACHPASTSAFDASVPFIVAIDGPAGAGKSSIAGEVARVLGMTRVDTGAIYRAVTLIALEEALDDAQIAARLPNLGLRFDGDRVHLGDREITAAIRTPEVTAEVSRVSAIAAVRDGLLGVQRTLGREAPGGAVMEGRDIGTVVFPEAPLKVFLTASVAERARRRQRDLEAAGTPCSLEEVEAAIAERDRYDSERAHAPLKKPDDAVVVDSTGKSPGQVVEEIAALVRAAREA